MPEIVSLDASAWWLIAGTTAIRSIARRALTLAVIVAGACHDPAAPASEPPLKPFVGELYTLVSLDGQSLPLTFEYRGSPYLLHGGLLNFLTDTSVVWDLSDLESVVPETDAIESVGGGFRYRQAAPDSLEVGGEPIAPFSLSPWAYGRRTGDVLELRTVDPATSNPHLRDFVSALGNHDWRFERRR